MIDNAIIAYQSKELEWEIIRMPKYLRKLNIMNESKNYVIWSLTKTEVWKFYLNNGQTYDELK